MAEDSVTPGTKTCTTCGEMKQTAEFYKWNQQRSDAPTASCKACILKRQSRIRMSAKSIRKDGAETDQWQEYLAKRRAYMASVRGQNREKMRQQERESRKRYRHKLLTELAGRPKPEKCEACNRPFGTESPRFDHDHRTGGFRGWICNSCNRALGFVKDDIGILERLIAYLRTERTVGTHTRTYSRHVMSDKARAEASVRMKACWADEAYRTKTTASMKEHPKDKPGALE